MVRHVCTRHSMAGVKSLGKAIRPKADTMQDRHRNIQWDTMTCCHSPQPNGWADDDANRQHKEKNFSIRASREKCEKSRFIKRDIWLVLSWEKGNDRVNRERKEPELGRGWRVKKALQGLLPVDQNSQWTVSIIHRLFSWKRRQFDCALLSTYVWPLCLPPSFTTVSLMSTSQQM